MPIASGSLSFSVTAVAAGLAIASILGFLHFLAFRRMPTRQRVLRLMLFLLAAVPSLFLPLIRNDDHIGTVRLRDAYRVLFIPEFYREEARSAEIDALVFGLPLLHQGTCLAFACLLSRQRKP